MTYRTSPSTSGSTCAKADAEPGEFEFGLDLILGGQRILAEGRAG